MLARLCIALVFGLGVALANATTLSISGGSFATEATTNAPGIPQGTTGYSSTVPAGGSPASLLLDSFSTLKFEFLGSQALNDNRLFLTANGMQISGNRVSAVGASAFIDMASGLVDFVFGVNTTAPGSRLFRNGAPTFNGTEQGTQYFNLQLPYAVEGSTSNPALRSGQIVLLGLSDGGGGAGDSDFKDMTIPIRVAPVPDTWMMMVAGLVIMGFVATRRARTH
jgi:hypothetical protein